LKRYVRNPSVSIQITEFRSQPVSVLGSVKNPGIVQLEGRKTLVEVLSLAGGTLDDAGSSVRLARRKEWGPVDLPGAKPDATGNFTVAEVSLKSVLENRTPAANIVIRPFDVISVPRADVIYVIGQVRKPGGFTLREREVVSVLHALAMAEGLDRMAAPKSSKILRATRTGSPRQEIALNLSKVMEGKAQDPVLQPDDILFIPVNQARNAALRSVEAAIQTVTGMVIWRR
jgi:polysaccharide export outer membrane protein